MLARRLRRALERLPAGGAEALEAGELELDRDARTRRAPDQLLTPPGDIVTRARFGVETEADLAAPVLGEGGQPVGEWRGRANSP